MDKDETVEEVLAALNIPDEESDETDEDAHRYAMMDTASELLWNVGFGNEIGVHRDQKVMAVGFWLMSELLSDVLDLLSDFQPDRGDESAA